MIPSAADASAIRSASTLISQSHKIDAMPNVSLAVFMIPYSSASADDKAIVDWFFDQDFIKCDPARIIPPDVDFRVFLSPAQSLSLKAVRRDTGFCHSYFMTNLGFPFKYLPSRFNSCQFELLCCHTGSKLLDCKLYVRSISCKVVCPCNDRLVLCCVFRV